MNMEIQLKFLQKVTAVTEKEKVLKWHSSVVVPVTSF